MDNIEFIVLPQSDEFYQKNLALCKFQLGESVSEEDFRNSTAIETNSSLFLILRWLSCIQNITLTDFDAWVIHTRETIEVAAQAYGIKFYNKDEQELISLGLAVRTFPFKDGAKELEKYCIPNILEAFISLDMSIPERAWAMEAVADLMISQMITDENKNLHLCLKLMRAKLDAHKTMEIVQENLKG